MEPPKVTRATFVTGSSWNTYKIENTQLNPDVTPLDIHRFLKAFDESYIVASDFVSLEDLICFGLHLEERPVEIKKKKRKGKPTKNVKFEPKIYKLKVAVSINDSLLFCNRLLNQNLRNIFVEVFEAVNLIPYDLSGSPPYELLLLFRQAASKQSKDNDLAKSKMALDAELDPLAEIRGSGRVEIGCAIRRCPAIRRLSANISHVSLKSANELVKDVKIDQVELEVVGPSIFETYLKFAEAKYIHDVPDWLTACRENGRTHAKILYN